MKQLVQGLFLVCAALIVGLFPSGEVAAQATPETTQTQQPSQTQVELNEQGIQALADGNYERAIRLFHASLDLGGLNVTYVNLGRAHQRAGECRRAHQFYEEALAAPAVEEPTPAQIEAAIANYRSEMQEQCPGFLAVACDPEEIALYIDDEGPMECATPAERELQPGQYGIRGEYEGNTTETTVSIEALQTSRVQLGLSTAEVATPEGPTLRPIAAPEPTPAPAPRDYASWPWFLGTAVAVGGGIALDTVPEQARNNELNAVNLVAVGLYATGAALGVVGVRNLFR